MSSPDLVLQVRPGQSVTAQKAELYEVTYDSLRERHVFRVMVMGFRFKSKLMWTSDHGGHWYGSRKEAAWHECGDAIKALRAENRAA